MDLRFTTEQEAFRAEARAFLSDRLGAGGRFAAVHGRGGPGDEHEMFDERWEWERELGRHGWIGLGWPTSVCARGATLLEQVIFYEEYARAGGPGRVGIINEGLIGPTIVHFGDDAQRAKFLPGILAGTEIWCQGYSEPNAGSDLASVTTRAVRDGGDFVVNGQKTWTTMALFGDWIFVLARTDPSAPKHRALSYLLVDMHQPGVEVRPLRQMSGAAGFGEVFFTDARTPARNVVGDPNDGW
ncbi:MAG TPA: acyl-CoA dehydrogenase family protein, partial [Acidimicrobiia bacterium]